MTPLADLALLDISAATGNPAVDAAAVRAKLSALRANVWPNDEVRRTEAKRLRRLACQLAQDPRPQYRSWSRSVYATARVVRGRPCPR
jgi:hypothetical protein